MTTPVPAGFGITLDASARQLRDDLWFGGSPARVIRLTPSGRRAWADLQDGPIATRPAGLLARRLTDSGLAHPTPPAHDAAAPPAGESAMGSVTVVVPVRDRVAELDRCLAALGPSRPVVVVDDGSADPAAVAAVAGRYGASVVRRDVNGGPGAARNTGLARVDTDFVAFVDSDCETDGGWIAALLGHLADPLVAAAAPRIVGLAPDTWCGRFTRARSSLDLGRTPARVAPGTRVGYVPTAALLVRRAALLGVARDGAAFDEALRVGEDVDLIWRLHHAGWRIRYEPSAEVRHHEPVTWTALLARRFRYGTSAGELARRHPQALAPLVLHPWPALCVAGLLSRRPHLAAAGFTGTVTAMARTLHRADVPLTGLLPATVRSVQQTWLGVGRYATQFAGPMLTAALVTRPRSHRRRGRRAAAASLLLGPPLAAWWAHRDALDPVRFTLGEIGDELAYGAGVWTGCLRAHVMAPTRPQFNRRPVRIDAPAATTKRSEQG